MGDPVYWFTAGLVFLVIMDLFNFKLPHDNGFWSLKTKGGEFKNDAWHWSKRAAIGCFAVAIYGFGLLWLAQCAVIAAIVQLGLYNGVIGFLTRKNNVVDTYGKD